MGFLSRTLKIKKNKNKKATTDEKANKTSKLDTITSDDELLEENDDELMEYPADMLVQQEEEEPMDGFSVMVDTKAPSRRRKMIKKGPETTTNMTDYINNNHKEEVVVVGGGGDDDGVVGAVEKENNNSNNHVNNNTDNDNKINNNNNNNPSSSSSSRAETTRSLIKKLIADVWNRGEIRLIPEICSPRLRFNGNNNGMDKVGHEGFARMVATIHEALSEYHCEIHSMVVEGNKGFCRLRFSGRHTGELLGHKPTNQMISWMGATEFTVGPDNKILKVWELGDMKSLEQQLQQWSREQQEQEQQQQQSNNNDP